MSVPPATKEVVLVSSYTTTLTATPRTRSESAYVLRGTGSPVEGMHVLGKTSVDMRVNPIFFRDRVNAAKQGSPPRGVPR